jgi:hypothetical protein
MKVPTSRIFAGAAVAALAVTTIVYSGGPAQALDNELGLPAFGDLVVDQDHDQVYITGGSSSNGVVVTDLDGRVKKTITGQYGATGLALNADNHKLYVALAAGDAISVIDTHTLKEVERHATGSRTCPTHLVRAGERLWFGHGCDGTWSGGVGRVTFPEPVEPDPSSSPSSSPSPSPTPSTPPKPTIDLNTQGDVPCTSTTSPRTAP